MIIVFVSSHCGSFEICASAQVFLYPLDRIYQQNIADSYDLWKILLLKLQFAINTDEKEETENRVLYIRLSRSVNDLIHNIFPTISIS